MSGDTVTLEPGQIWSHTTNEFEVQVTRVSDDYVHFDYPEGIGKQQAAELRDLAEEQFDTSFVHISPVIGSAEKKAVFTANYSFERLREKESFET